MGTRFGLKVGIWEIWDFDQLRIIYNKYYYNLECSTSHLTVGLRAIFEKHPKSDGARTHTWNLQRAVNRQPWSPRGMASRDAHEARNTEDVKYQSRSSTRLMESICNLSLIHI